MAKSLLLLPREIRMEIYSYLLITETGINSFTKHTPGTLHLHPAILRTCQKIFEEAASILTQRNLFIYQSYNNATHDRPLTEESDRIRDITQNQYRCPPTYGLPAHITSRSRRIWHLEIRLDGECDYEVALAVLDNVLAPHNMLKTLDLEIWDIWQCGKLQKVLTKMAGSPSRIAINIGIFERSSTLKLERGPDRLGKSIIEWNQTSEHGYVETKSELTPEQWNRLWRRGCYRVRRWTLSPRAA